MQFSTERIECTLQSKCVYDSQGVGGNYGWSIKVANLAVLPLDCDRHGEINTSNAASVSDTEA